VDFESILATTIIIIAILIFTVVFIIVALSFIRWFRVPAYKPTLTIKVEDYACPKCGSKELELIGRKTLRCKKCGTTFIIHFHRGC